MTAVVKIRFFVLEKHMAIEIVILHNILLLQKHLDES